MKYRSIFPLKALFLLLSVTLAGQQPCQSCDCIIEKAMSAAGAGEYEIAIKKLTAARNCQENTQGVAKVDALILEVFNRINNLRLAIEEEKRRADENARLAQEQAEKADSLKVRAEAEARAARNAYLEKERADRERRALQLRSAIRSVEATDPTLALRLAHEGCKLGDSIPPNLNLEFIKIRRDLLSNQEIYYYSRVFEGHSDRINGVAFSPDGKKVLTGGIDDNAKLWDIQTGIDEVTYQGHTGDIEGVAFSPDGKKVVTGSIDATVRVWDTQAGQLLLQLNSGGPVSGVAFSPDGRYILAGSGDGNAYVWEAATGQLYHRLSGHNGGVGGVAFSPDGNEVLTGSSDQTALRWDLATGASIDTLFGHTDQVDEVAYSHDGKMILTSSNDRTARLWDRQSGDLIKVLAGHEAAVNGVGFARGDRLAATASKDRTIRLWDTQTGQMLKILRGHSAPVDGIAFSDDGNFLISGSSDQTAILWDLLKNQASITIEDEETPDYAYTRPNALRRVVTIDTLLEVYADLAIATPTLIAHHPFPITHYSFSPNDSLLLTYSVRDRTAKIWEVITGSEEASFAFNEYATAVALVNRNLFITGNRSGELAFWSGDTGEKIKMLSDSAGYLKNLVLSQDAATLLTIYNQGKVVLRNLNSTSEEPLFAVSTNYEIEDASLSSDQRFLLVGEETGRITLWDLTDTGQKIRTFNDHYYLADIQFLPDGRYFLSAAPDGTVALWDRRQSTPLLHYQANFNISDLSVSPQDGSRILASGEGRAILWPNLLYELEEGSSIAQLSVKQRKDNGVLFSPQQCTRSGKIEDLKLGAEYFYIQGRKDEANTLLTAIQDSILKSPTIITLREGIQFLNQYEGDPLQLFQLLQDSARKASTYIEFEQSLLFLYTNQGRDYADLLLPILLDSLLQTPDLYRQMKGVEFLHTYGREIKTDTLFRNIADAALLIKELPQLMDLADFFDHFGQSSYVGPLLDLTHQIGSQKTDLESLKACVDFFSRNGQDDRADYYYAQIASLLAGSTKADEIMDGLQFFYSNGQTHYIESLNSHCFAALSQTQDFDKLLEAANFYLRLRENENVGLLLTILQGKLAPDDPGQIEEVATIANRIGQYEISDELYSRLFDLSQRSEISYYADRVASYFDSRSRAAYSRNDFAQTVVFQEKSIAAYRRHCELNPDEYKLRTLAGKLGGLGWYYIFDGQYDRAIAVCEEGIELDSARTFIHTNRALGYLFNGQLDDAVSIYAEWKDESYANSGGSSRMKTFGDVFLKDLYQLDEQQLFPTKYAQDVKKIIDWLSGDAERPTFR